MNLVLYLFVCLAGIGLILSLIVHVASILGTNTFFDSLVWDLGMGVFFVWIPTVIVALKLTKDVVYKQGYWGYTREYLRALFRGCPKWMKNMAYGFFVYGMINFILFMVLDISKGGVRRTPSGTPLLLFRGFSGHWMIFYSAALAILYSAIKVKETDEDRKGGRMSGEEKTRG